MYYIFYLNNKDHFIISSDILNVKEHSELHYRDFLYFSTLTNFTVTFGDIIPATGRIKLLIGLQVFLFWYVTLF